LLNRTATTLAGDLLDHLQIDSRDSVGMIGYFAPVVEALRKIGCDLHVFERRGINGPNVHPSSDIPIVLPSCRIVIITSVTLVNKSFEDVIKHVDKNKATVIMLGPSTPLSTAFFASRGVAMLGGVKINDASKVLDVVGEGGGTREFIKYCEKVVVRV
jgi:uncharacterized protein